MKGKIYYTCTYDFSHVTGYHPWCSTKTDDNDNHIGGQSFYGNCLGRETCRNELEQSRMIAIQS